MSPVVVLVGPPGAGKSTVGALLATILGVEFVDTDLVVEAGEGITVAELFTTRGEAAFRELEERAVAHALTAHDGVLSLGGGAVLSDATRAALTGHVVAHLDVGMAEGVRRTGLGAGRPLLAGLNPRATFKTLLDARAPLYREVATLHVPTDGRVPSESAADIAARLAVRSERTEQIPHA